MEAWAHSPLEGRVKRVCCALEARYVAAAKWVRVTEEYDGNVRRRCLGGPTR